MIDERRITNMRKQYFLHCSIFLILYSFTGCGSGEANYTLEDVNPTFKGKFLDEAVEGLDYERSGGDKGVTAKGGYYEYQQHENITFKVGALSIGNTQSAGVTTPRELATDANVIEDPSVNNRVRFLLALDSNASIIGIQINDETRMTAKSWKSSMDFSLNEAAFSNEIQRVTGDSIAALPSPLPTASEATQHFSKTLRCAYSGGYEGSWLSNDSDEAVGFVGAMIQATGPVLMMGSIQDENGTAVSIVYIRGEQDINQKKFVFNSNKSTAYFYNPEIQQLQAVIGQYISGAGNSKNYNLIEGSFVNDVDGNDVTVGGFKMKRADALPNAVYRYTGFGYPLGLSDTEYLLGMIIFDIDVDGNVAGMIHDVRDPFNQPQLDGSVDFDTGDIVIVIKSEPKAVLRGNINFEDTSIDPDIKWYPDLEDAAPFGYVDVTGCQLQSL